MISIIAMLCLAAVRALALLIEFDDSASYYIHGAELPVIFTVGAVIAVAAALVFVILLRGKLNDVTIESDSGAVIFTSALFAFILVGGTLYDVISGSIGEGPLAIASAIFALPAAIYFILSISMPVKSRDAQVIMSVFMMLWMFTKIVGTYFAGGIEINNPNKMMLLTAMAVTLIFLVSEGRFRLGTERRGLYIFAGLTSLIVTGMYSLPNAILIMLRAYPDIIDPIRELVMLTLFIYMLVRMCVVSGMIGMEDEDYDQEDDEAEGYGTSVNGYKA